MPIYVYVCKECDNSDEKFKKKIVDMKDDVNEKCSKCESSMKRVYSTSIIDCSPHHVSDCDLSYDKKNI